MSEVTVAKMAKAYLRIRDARKAASQEFEAKDNELKEAMELLERQMLAACKETGASSLRVEGVGTIIRSTKVRYWPSDWEAMHKFILAHGAPDLLERRISQTSMKEWVKDHPDNFPPGLNSSSEESITVRRS